MIQPDEDDYWQGLEGAATASPVSAAFPELQVRIIPEARPLIHALGNFDPRAIPEPLEAVLFAPDGPAADLGGKPTCGGAALRLQKFGDNRHSFSAQRNSHHRRPIGREAEFRCSYEWT